MTALLANLDVSDAELAVRLGLTRQTIYNRRHGRRGITSHQIIEMAEALDVPPGLFVGSRRDAVQWLIDNGYLDDEDVDPGDTSSPMGDFAWNVAS